MFFINYCLRTGQISSVARRRDESLGSLEIDQDTYITLMQDPCLISNHIVNIREPILGNRKLIVKVVPTISSNPIVPLTVGCTEADFMLVIHGSSVLELTVSADTVFDSFSQSSTLKLLGMRNGNIWSDVKVLEFLLAEPVCSMETGLNLREYSWFVNRPQLGKTYGLIT